MNTPSPHAVDFRGNIGFGKLRVVPEGVQHAGRRLDRTVGLLLHQVAVATGIFPRRDPIPGTNLVAAADHRQLLRCAVGRIAKDQVPVDEPGEVRVEAAQPLEQSAAVREGVEVDHVLEQHGLAVERFGVDPGIAGRVIAPDLREIHRIAVRFDGEGLHDRRERAGKPRVVGVEVGDDLPLALRESVIARGGRPQVMLQPKADAWVRLVSDQ